MTDHVKRDEYGLSGYLSSEADWYPCTHFGHFKLCCRIIFFRRIHSQPDENGKLIHGENLLSKIGFIKMGWLTPEKACLITFPDLDDYTYVGDTTVAQDAWLKQYYHLMGTRQKKMVKQFFKYKEHQK